MVIALAGRRIDADDADVRRFPPAMKDAVRGRLRDLFEARGATALVCSGACGADLLALDAAGELGLHRRMVLPFAPERFRQTSVIDRSDGAWWGRLFDRVVGALPPEDLLVLEDTGQSTEAYVAANEAILDEALHLARERPAQQPARDASDHALAVIVWEGRPRGESDITAGFADSARDRGMEVVEVSTQ